MMTDDEMQQIRACMDALRDGIEGIRSRWPQLEMIAAVAKTLAHCRAEDEQAGDGDHIAVVEAGTGTGIEITVPETAVRLKQQLGRLLKTTNDWGRRDDP